jgi:hypothetical protein
MTAPSFRPNLPAPFVHTEPIRLYYSQEQFNTFTRIADAGRDTIKTHEHVKAAIELCCSICDMYYEGSVVLITAPSVRLDVNLGSLRVAQIRPFASEQIDITPYQERIGRLADLLNLDEYEDILCSVWHNYLHIMRHLLPRRGAPRTLVEVHSGSLCRKIIIPTMPKR